MKVIFLDFDGVLNSEKYFKRVSGTGLVIDPSEMELLKQIVTATDAKIVLSTSWREHWSKNTDECDAIGLEIEAIFRSYGLEIWDKTQSSYRRREPELKDYLDAHPEVENFVVLDDMLLYADYLKKHIVKTSGYRGLDQIDTEKAIAILNR